MSKSKVGRLAWKAADSLLFRDFLRGATKTGAQVEMNDVTTALANAMAYVDESNFTFQDPAMLDTLRCLLSHPKWTYASTIQPGDTEGFSIFTHDYENASLLGLYSSEGRLRSVTQGAPGILPQHDSFYSIMTEVLPGMSAEVVKERGMPAANAVRAFALDPKDPSLGFFPLFEDNIFPLFTDEIKTWQRANQWNSMGARLQQEPESITSSQWADLVGPSHVVQVGTNFLCMDDNFGRQLLQIFAHAGDAQRMIDLAGPDYEDAEVLSLGAKDAIQVLRKAVDGTHKTQEGAMMHFFAALGEDYEPGDVGLKHMSSGSVTLTRDMYEGDLMLKDVLQAAERALEK